MKESDWIKIALGIVFGWIITGGLAYMQLFIDLRFYLVPLVLLIASFYIWIRYFREPNTVSRVKKVFDEVLSSWKKMKAAKSYEDKKVILLLKRGEDIAAILDANPDSRSDPAIKQALQIATEMVEIIPVKRNIRTGYNGLPAINLKMVDRIMNEIEKCALKLGKRKRDR